MQILEITISELQDFTNSSLWKQLNPKPVSALRAISQANNPRAKAEDIALIIAFDNDVLVGLVGLLPDWLNGNEMFPIYSNSCWWAHPEKGKHLAIPLFLKAFSVCNQRMFMTDCTPHTLQILKKTNWFDFPETPAGMRGYLNFKLSELIPAKFPSAKKLIPLLKLSDRFLNLLLRPYQKIQLKRLSRNCPELEYPQTLDQELTVFITKHSVGEFTRRSGSDLQWILQFPWVKTTDNGVGETIDYPFSYIIGNFRQQWVKILDSGKLIGLMLISVRDGQLKIPYAYFDDRHSGLVLNAIYYQALSLKVDVLTVFNVRLVNEMKQKNHPFVFRKDVKRLMAVSKTLSDSYQQYPSFQDGDGDVVFT